ncbi:hypothetical protein PIB30_034417 [Stylosanthes scabra]|uniref:Uncharacterized protein n=1 Tax=Stylosanthes scabra TaxID=79078 RepID=A0ABU6QCH9_9FABA|nr:hypothetical protein [Stylosanthes scabra]
MATKAKSKNFFCHSSFQVLGTLVQLSSPAANPTAVATITPHDLINTVDKTTQESFATDLEKIRLWDFVVGAIPRNGPAQIWLTTGPAITFVDGYTSELPASQDSKKILFSSLLWVSA